MIFGWRLSLDPDHAPESFEIRGDLISVGVQDTLTDGGGRGPWRYRYSSQFGIYIDLGTPTSGSRELSDFCVTFPATGRSMMQSTPRGM